MGGEGKGDRSDHPTEGVEEGHATANCRDIITSYKVLGVWSVEVTTANCKKT